MIKLITMMMDEIRPLKHMADDLEMFYSKLEEMLECIEANKINEVIETCEFIKKKMEPMKSMPQVIIMFHRINMLQNLSLEKDVNAMELAKMIQVSTSEELDEFSKMCNRIAERLLFEKNAKITEIKENGQNVGFEFNIRNPSYVAMPVSTLEQIELTINKIEAEPRDIYYIIRNQRINALDAPTIHEIWIGYGEVFRIYVNKPLYWFTFNQKEFEVDFKLKSRTTINYGIPDGLMKTIVSIKMEVA